MEDGMESFQCLCTGGKQWCRQMASSGENVQRFNRLDRLGTKKIEILVRKSEVKINDKFGD